MGVVESAEASYLPDKTPTNKNADIEKWLQSIGESENSTKKPVLEKYPQKTPNKCSACKECKSELPFGRDLYKRAIEICLDDNEESYCKELAKDLDESLSAIIALEFDLGPYSKGKNNLYQQFTEFHLEPNLNKEIGQVMKKFIAPSIGLAAALGSFVYTTISGGPVGIDLSSLGAIGSSLGLGFLSTGYLKDKSKKKREREATNKVLDELLGPMVESDVYTNLIYPFVYPTPKHKGKQNKKLQEELHKALIEDLYLAIAETYLSLIKNKKCKKL